MPITSRINPLWYSATEESYVFMRMNKVQLSTIRVMNLIDMMWRGKSRAKEHVLVWFHFYKKQK